MDEKMDAGYERVKTQMSFLKNNHILYLVNTGPGPCIRRVKSFCNIRAHAKHLDINSLHCVVAILAAKGFFF